MPSSALHLCEQACEILGDVNAEELKAAHPLHRCLVDGNECVFSALSPVIHHQLLGLVDVEFSRGGSPGTILSGYSPPLCRPSHRCQ